MHEATKGIDFKRALDVLQEAKALPKPGANGERTRFFRIAGRGLKLYPIDPDKLSGCEHGA
jgi:putative DNA primase/helicase